jgi:hypothetical protein
MQEWRADIQLIWDNARKYNGENHPVTNQAAKLEAAVDRRMENAVEIAKANMSAEARGEPRPRKSMQPRNAELNVLLSGQLGSSDSDSMDEPAAGGAAAAAAGRVSHFLRQAFWNSIVACSACAQLGVCMHAAQ